MMLVDAVVLLSIFLAGMLVGAGMFISYGFYHLRKLNGEREEVAKKIKEKTDELESKKNSIKDRLVQASNLAKTQLEIKALAEQPSKNALHSKYKNGLVYELKELERQKLSILSSILKDGFDPTVTILNDSGQSEEVSLSSYVYSAIKVLSDAEGIRPSASPEQHPTTPDMPPNTKKIGKFIVHKGGKDDGTTH